jgi:hypothetical protein
MINFGAAAHREYIKALTDEETMWILKSRILWLQAGDKNTVFFHRQAKVRRWTNQVNEIKTQSGESICDFDQIKQQATSHYNKLYSSEGDLDNDLSNHFLSHIPHLISEVDNLKLNKPIEEE